MGEGEGLVGEGRVGEGIGERKGGEAGERGDGVGGEGVRWRKKRRSIFKMAALYFPFSQIAN